MMVAASYPYPASSYQILTKQRSRSKLDKQIYIQTYRSSLQVQCSLDAGER